MSVSICCYVLYKKPYPQRYRNLLVLGNVERNAKSVTYCSQIIFLPSHCRTVYSHAYTFDKIDYNCDIFYWLFTNFLDILKKNKVIVCT